MKYSIIKCINGAFIVDSEHGELTQAKVRFHAVCQTLWNAPGVLTAKVVLVDEQFNRVACRVVHHSATGFDSTTGSSGSGSGSR